MTSPDSSQSSSSRIKSVSLGSNEEFVRLWNELIKFRHAEWGLTILEEFRALDRLVKRAEKYAQLDEVVALITRLIKRADASTRLISEKFGTFSLVKLSVEIKSHLWWQMHLIVRLCAVLTNSVASGRDSAYNVVVSAVVLLALVYQYLLGCVDRGGSKTYSSGSLDFRDTFVCMVLFRGAYVWIKFRQAACPANRPKRKSLETPHQASPLGSRDEFPDPEGGVYRRAVRNKFGTVTRFKYEPRFKPPRERLDSATTLIFNYLSLGSYDTDHEARAVRHIAAFYYGKELEGHIQFEDGRRFSIPCLSEQEKSLAGKEKAEWVKRKTKAVYADLLEEQARQTVQLLNPTLRTNSQLGGATTDAIQCSEMEAYVALGTNGSELGSLPAGAPSPASDQFDWCSFIAGSEDDQNSSWANVPAPQSSGRLDNHTPTGGVTYIAAYRGGCLPQVAGSAAQDLEHGEPQLPSPPMESLHGQVNHLQQLMTCQSSGRLDNQMPTGGVTDIIAHCGGCLPQVAGSAAQDLEHREPRLTNPSMESLHGQVNHLQQLVACYKNKLQDVQHQLMESEVEKSELRRENESLRSMGQLV